MAYNTNNPIGSTDARDLDDNAENLDYAVNSDNLTWTDRLGKTRTTLNGAFIQIDNSVSAVESAKDGAIVHIDNSLDEYDDAVTDALNSIGVIVDDPVRNWSASLLVSDMRAHRYPANTGDIYIPKRALPFTTGSTFNSNNWVLYQTATATSSSTDTTPGRLLKVGADEEQFSSATKDRISYAADAGVWVKNIKRSPTGPGVAGDRGLVTFQDVFSQGTDQGWPSTSNWWSGVRFTSVFSEYQPAFLFNLSDVWLANIKADGTGLQSQYKMWTEGNTTVDGSGFIKEASPIVKLHYDHAEFNGQCPESAEFEKVDTGHYLIKGTKGFAQNGWYIENPKDANANVKVYVDYEQLEDNTIEIKTYEPDYSTGKCMAGVPSDIPSGRWIDLRLEADTVNDDQPDIVID